MTDKIPTPEAAAERATELVFENAMSETPLQKNMIAEAFREYAKEVLRYTLQQAAEKAHIIPLSQVCGGVVSKQSILSLEEEIIQTLGL